LFKETQMKNQKKYSRLMIGVLLLLVLAIGGTAVLAQSQDDPVVTPPADEGDTDSDTVVPNPFTRGEGQERPDFGERGPGRGNDGTSGEDLAEALGITVEELQAAQEAARAAALEQAVADGLITQEQADQIAESGGRSLRGGHFGDFGDKDELLAEALGITVEELQAAQEEVRAAKLAQMVEDGVITQEQADLMEARRAVQSYFDVESVQAAIQEAYETAVNEALAAGEITQEMADQLLSEDAAVPGFGGFGGRGGHRGHGPRGGQGMMPQDGSSLPSNSANTADSDA
jgi:hypothetical protein